MFTSCNRRGGGAYYRTRRRPRIEIEKMYDTDEISVVRALRAQACLTVIEKGPGWFAVEASAETLDKTALGDWVAGTSVNLERALRIGDELGGHIVSGHVDAVAVITGMQSGDSVPFTFEMPSNFAKYIAPKGSVCLDGVSLTVNRSPGQLFGVNIISHTQVATSFNDRKVGDRINMEIDTHVARYVARLMGKE